MNFSVKRSPAHSTAASSQSKNKRRLLGACGLMLAVALGVSASAASMGHSDPGELVANGGMENGTVGWRTNDADSQHISIHKGGKSGSYAAKLTTTTTQTAVFNDATNTVLSAKADASYLVSAWVRTDAPEIFGQLRIMQDQGAEPTTGKSFHLTTTEWTKVDFVVVSNAAGAVMDLNVLAWGLEPGQDLLIDDVSMQEISAPSSAPPVTASPAPVPAVETIFGSSLGMSSSGGDLGTALAREEERFGTLGLVRKFENLLPSSWSSLSILAGKSLVISFQPPPADVLAGHYDAELLRWFEEAPRTSETYWSYIHEPEAHVKDGKFTTAEYRAAWQRISDLAKRANNPRLHATLVLMGWTVNPESGLNWKDYYAGDAYLDVVAWDPYNDAGSVAGPQHYPDPALIFDASVAASKSVNKPYAVAETGSRLIPTDPTGAGRAAWLAKVGQYLKDNDAVFVAYWDSAVAIGDYRLTDAPSAAAWRRLVTGTD